MDAEGVAPTQLPRGHTQVTRELLHRGLFEHALLEVHIWELVRDKLGRIVTWRLVDANAAALKSWGRDLETIIGKTTAEIFPGTDPVKTFLPVVEEIMTTGRPKEWQVDFAGTEQALHMVSIPVGEFFVSTGFDVTADRKRERDLARALERLTEAQRIGRIGDWEWDIASNHIEWSAQVFELMGRDPALGPPAGVSDLETHFDAGSVERMRVAIDAAVRTRTKQEYELTTIAHEGAPRILYAVADPMLNESGEVTGLHGIVQDISERKKLEQNFLRAQRMESIGNLAGGIAHDLNNVLAPIMLSLELLRESFPDAESRQLIQTIEQSAQHGASMVKQVLAFARGVGGQRLAVEVRPLVLDIARIASDTFLKNIEVVTQSSDSLWTVRGDQTQLHQVILNLCLNARDAMPHGGTLTVTAENILLDEQYAGLTTDVEAGPHVRISVVDTGVGMTPSTLAQIFDPFFTTKELGRGTGLGLSTAQAIIKSHGGFIRVYSELGRGSTFSVYLPASTDLAAGESKPAASLPRGRGQLVLVVDDEPSVRHVTQQTLEAFGYRTLTANDGAEALAVFTKRGTEVAVVITDMMMPTMDGASLIRVLRKLDPRLRIIAASGLDVKSQVAGLGVEHTLTKPFAAEALLTLLRDVLA